MSFKSFDNFLTMGDSDPTLKTHFALHQPISYNKPMKTHLKKYFAELLGTFSLSLAVVVAVHAGGPISVPLVAGLTLGLFVYSLGHISGAHFNPAVTLGAWTVGKIKHHDAILYLIAQFIGAGLAMMVAVNSGANISLIVANTGAIALAEIIGTFFFTFGIAAVVFGKTPAQMSGLTIGASLVLGVVVASALGSNGVLNPAVAMALGSFNLMYLVGPIIGSILGMNVYRIFTE
jgi:aquaporin Z